MAITIEKTKIKGVLLITPHIYKDDRGLYIKHFEKMAMWEAGIKCSFTESSDLISRKGSLRGLHYQTECSQAKLVHTVRGKVFDVALDLRRESDTFGEYYCCLLDAKDNKAIFIPEGFAHGYLSLTENSIFCYQSSGTYIPEACGGIIWDDIDLSIPWPLKEYGIESVIATDKDRNWPSFRKYAEHK